MKNILFSLAILSTITLQAQQNFDIASFAVPSGWQQSQIENAFSISKENTAKGTYCLITIYKALDAANNPADNFKMSWEEIVKNNFGQVGEPEMQEAEENDGWEIVSGHALFSKESINGAVILISSTQLNKVANVLVLTNTDDYESEVTSFLSSIRYEKPIGSTYTEINNSMHSTPTTDNIYQFNTTNFPDGWTSIVKEDWVEVNKGNIKVILHFPKQGTLIEGDPTPVVNNAWNILVAPRYSKMSNYRSGYVSDYVRQYYGTAHVTENATNKKVFVVLYARDGGWIECVAPTKEAFIKEFNFDPEMDDNRMEISTFRPLGNMKYYNRFAIAANDLNNTGKWKDQFSSNTFYTNYYTGASAGMSTYSSTQEFIFTKNNNYSWEHNAANSYGGSTQFSRAKGKGQFKIINDWKIQFSDMEGKPRTYDAYFSAIKNDRILWLNGEEYKGEGEFTGFQKTNN